MLINTGPGLSLSLGLVVLYLQLQSKEFVQASETQDRLKLCDSVEILYMTYVIYTTIKMQITNVTDDNFVSMFLYFDPK